jgi:hypothetical protein
VLKQLARRTIQVAEQESVERLNRANEAFKTACNTGCIEERLRDDVRNRVTAHRQQQSLESHHQAHLALTDQAFPELITATRRLLWTMQTARIWFWGASRGEGLHVMRCRTRGLTTLDMAPCGFEVLDLPNLAQPTAVAEDDVAEEFDAQGLTDAIARANRFWGMQAEALDCCGRKKPRRTRWARSRRS